MAVAVGAGGLAALAAALIHHGISAWPVLPPEALSRYVAPITEETLKAVFVVVMLRRRRLGFLVDAAIVGFAVGTGFALVENLEYLTRSTDTRFVFWMVRGFGTAILHGATVAVFALIAKALTTRFESRPWLAFLPGWLAAVVTHSAYNHFLLPPLVATAVLVVSLPVVVSVVFERSERATREWVGEGLDLDVALLELVTSADFGRTRLGTYLRELKDRFTGPVVGDMFCLLRLELELAIRAKGMLMARANGLDMPLDAGVTARLAELRYLQQSIGATGMLALAPLRVASERDDWHRFLLEQAGQSSGWSRWTRRVRSRRRPRP